MKRILLAAATLALAAGCGTQAGATGVASIATSQAAPSASATATATADPQEQGRKFAQCMRDNGVDMPDPDPNGGGPQIQRLPKGDMEKFRKAMEACRELSPMKERMEASPEQQEQLRQFAQCMRDNGVDMPDPDPNGGFGGKRPALKPDDPKFKKAFETCREKFPRMGARK